MINDINIKDHQIACLIKIVKDDLTICQYIIKYPGEKNYDPGKLIDSFYRKIYNLFFSEAILVMNSLFDRNDSKVISLWNWSDFISKKKNELEKLTQDFEKKGFKQIRDQILAHQDFNNPNNYYICSSMQGWFNIDLLNESVEIINNIITEFMDYTKTIKSPWAENTFSSNDVQRQIEQIMEKAPPYLTPLCLI